MRARSDGIKRPRRIGSIGWVCRAFSGVQPDDGSEDVFVHISAVEQAGLNSLQEGQKVSYELFKDPKRGRTSAEQLKAM